jgi:hypothetical protein
MDTKIVDFIKHTSQLYNIDDSHGLKHSLETLRWSLLITKDDNLTHDETTLIKLSCLLHDMCDKKYMNEIEGVERIVYFLKYVIYISNELTDKIVFIITNMSYSKVIKYGYPSFNLDNSLEYCYHVVRNSDLLGSYDPERCIQYQIRCGGTRKEGIKKMLELFDIRILTQLDAGYVNLEPAKKYAIQLQREAISKLDNYRLELEKSNINTGNKNEELMDCIS